MSEPRVLAEVEMPEPHNVRSLGADPRAHQAPRAPSGLAAVWATVAHVLAKRSMALMLVVAMIGLSYMAVEDPTTHRLIAAGGFDVLALIGVWLLGRQEQAGA